MRNRNTSENANTRRLLPVGAAALAVAATLSLPQAALAARITPPPVPDLIRVEAEFKPFLLGHGVGTQNYVCLPSGAGFAWSLFTPEATLFNDHDRQLTTHFFSPNPEEQETVRATWLHSKDSSTVWGKVNQMSSDARFVAPGAIPWLLVEKTGAQEGPDGGDTLTVTKFIQRVNTAGGAAPSTGCAVATDVGKRAFVPYKADYIFYRERNGDDEGDE